MKNLFKKLLVFTFIIIATSTAITLNASADGEDTKTGWNGRACNTFLGLTSWDCGVTENVTSESQLKSNVIQIAANVATDIAIISAYLVLGYVIYGGYLYTFSGGDAGKVANGKKTLTQAFIGLAITMLANAIMSTIRFVLLGNNGKFTDCTQSSCVSANDLVEQTIGWFIGTAGIVSAIFLVYGGISYIISSGDPNKTQKAKQMMLYSVIGLIIVALATAITAFVSNIIRGAQAS